ncbi:MAG: hypothetical protein ACO3A2_08525 [Bdellovibrionia bacterium]
MISLKFKSVKHLSFIFFITGTLILMEGGTSFCFAQPLMIEQPLEPSSDENTGHVRPNEVFIGDATAIFSKSQPGVYISVGTERGFIGAALSNASRLILVDLGRDVIRFNRINTGLLKLAHDRQDYIFLRNEASASEWMRRSAALAENDSAKPVLQDPENWNWWSTLVNQHEIFQALKSPYTECGEGMIPFENASYLIDNTLFQRLKDLATQDHIESHVLDLGDLPSVDSLSKSLARSNESIGVLDLSNVWDGAYLGTQGVTELIQSFEENMRPDSIILQTSMSNPVHGWSYHGLTFESLKNAGSFFERIETLYDRLSDEKSLWNILATFNGVVLKVLSENAIHCYQSQGVRVPEVRSSISTDLYSPEFAGQTAQF